MLPFIVGDRFAEVVFVEGGYTSSELCAKQRVVVEVSEQEG